MRGGGWLPASASLPPPPSPPPLAAFSAVRIT
jgi:hypothetical protein